MNKISAIGSLALIFVAINAGLAELDWAHVTFTPWTIVGGVLAIAVLTLVASVKAMIVQQQIMAFASYTLVPQIISAAKYDRKQEYDTLLPILVSLWTRELGYSEELLNKLPPKVVNDLNSWNDKHGVGNNGGKIHTAIRRRADLVSSWQS